MVPAHQTLLALGKGQRDRAGDRRRPHDHAGYQRQFAAANSPLGGHRLAANGQGAADRAKSSTPATGTDLGGWRQLGWPACCLTERCYPRDGVVLFGNLISRSGRLWACGRRVRRWATHRVVHGRARCAAGASSTCPWPAGRAAPGPPRPAIFLPAGLRFPRSPWSPF